MFKTLMEASQSHCPMQVGLLCEGRACMAWRWWDTSEPKKRDEGPELLAHSLVGYCGLAGRPHTS